MKVIDYLKEYNKKNIYPFHMPGNKRQGEFNQLDFTEVENLDNLYHPEGIYKESLDRIKNLYSTKESYILVPLICRRGYDTYCDFRITVKCIFNIT